MGRAILGTQLHVLLVHGLGRTTLSVASLARFLRGATYSTETFGYFGAVESFARIQRRLRQRLEKIARQRRQYAVIGHSLGGLLLRAALPGVTPAPQHLIMLGTPNRSPRLAGRFGRFWPFRLATGDPGRRLADAAFCASLPLPGVPYTIVAGTGGFRGRGSPFGDEPNDWIVAVSETMLSSADRPVLLPVGHTFMMNNSAVRTAILRALGNGVAAVR